MTYPEPQKPDSDYPLLQLELDIQSEPQFTELEVQPQRRHRREWWQDPLIRTWLFPPVIGAGLGVLAALSLMTLLVVLGLLANNRFVLPTLDFIPVFGQLGGYGGAFASLLVHLRKYPQGKLAQTLQVVWQRVAKGLETVWKGLVWSSPYLWKATCVIVLLFAVLMSFGLLGGLLGSQLNRKL